MSDNPIMAAYDELVADTTYLRDPEARHPTSAVVVQAERDGWGEFHVDVSLREIEGSQLQFVLNIARRYELDVHEMNGWLRLGRHYNDTDVEDDPEPALEAAP